MSQRGLPTLALSLVAVTTAAGQERPGWQFKAGNRFYLESTIAVKDSRLGYEIYHADRPAAKGARAKGVPSGLAAGSLTAVSSFKVLRRERDGIVLEQKIESVKITEGKGMYEHYLALQEGLPGAVLTIRLNGRGEITRLDGYRDLFRKACRKMGAAPVELEALLTEGLVRQFMAAALLLPPDGGLAPGDTWKRTLRVLPVVEPVGYMGALRLDLEYRCEGKTDGEEKVTVRGTPRHVPPRPGATIWPYRFVKGEIRKEEARGSLVFKSGRLVRLDLRVPFRGTLTWDTGSAAQICEIEHEVTMRFRVLDALPKP
jgi:hypothetical protein